MPHSNFKHKIHISTKRAFKCPCAQTFNYESNRDKNKKMQLHNKFCDKLQAQPKVVVPRQPMKNMTQEEHECMCANRREFRV